MYFLFFYHYSQSASDVKATADMVKEALEEAGKAQSAAEKAIKQADDDIKGTNDLLTSVSCNSRCQMTIKPPFFQL